MPFPRKVTSQALDQVHAPVIADSDYLWGLAAIARHIGKLKPDGRPDIRAVGRMVALGIVPVAKVGHRLVVGQKSKIDATFTEASEQHKRGVKEQ
jgi:hypothetical protein